VPLKACCSAAFVMLLSTGGATCLDPAPPHQQSNDNNRWGCKQPEASRLARLGSTSGTGLLCLRRQPASPGAAPALQWSECRDSRNGILALYYIHERHILTWPRSGMPETHTVSGRGEKKKRNPGESAFMPSYSLPSRGRRCPSVYVQSSPVQHKPCHYYSTVKRGDVIRPPVPHSKLAAVASLHMPINRAVPPSALYLLLPRNRIPPTTPAAIATPLMMATPTRPSLATLSSISFRRSAA
jgi:hypothetical protein